MITVKWIAHWRSKSTRYKNPSRFVRYLEDAPPSLSWFVLMVEGGNFVGGTKYRTKSKAQAAADEMNRRQDG